MIELREGGTEGARAGCQTKASSPSLPSLDLAAFALIAPTSLITGG